MQSIKYISFLFVVLFSIGIIAQDLEKQKRIANSHMRNANDLYHQSKYADAEVAYKKSLASYPENPKAIYNLANAIMQQKRFKEAIKHYDYLAKNSKSNKIKAESYHNTGNAYMELNNFQKAVDAYKNALRINPKDEETRYNLAYAQELLKQQQQQNKDNKDQQNKDDKNKDQKNKNKDNKDQQNKDDKNKDNKDQQNKNKKDKDKKDDKKKENEDKEKDKDKENKEDKKEDNKDESKDKPKDEPKPKEQEGDEKKQQQPRLGKLTPQQAKQLLEALQNEEKKTQDKMNAKRIKGKPVKTEKDW